MRQRTLAVHAGNRRSQYGETSEAVYLTQGFVYRSAEQAEARFIECGADEFIYARYGNPTTRMLEDRMAAICGAEDGFATASGMAAVNGALFSMLRAGDHIVSARALFGSCLYIVKELLPRFGIEVTLIDGVDLAAWEAAIRPDTKAVFLETMSNPGLEVVDLEAVAALAHARGACVVVDAALSTPIFQDCIAQGADLVIYSTTKHVDGQGRCLGGMVLGRTEFIRGTLEPYLKHTGSAASPFNAWVMLKGCETLAVRCQAQAQSALEIANRLDGHPNLSRVLYPHLPSHPQYGVAQRLLMRGGTLLSIDIEGGREAAFRFMNALQLLHISNNFADAKSLVTHPATTTHQRLEEDERGVLGITDGFVRISIGLEDIDDLAHDIEHALRAI